MILDPFRRETFPWPSVFRDVDDKIIGVAVGGLHSRVLAEEAREIGAGAARVSGLRASELYFAMLLGQSTVCDVKMQPGSVDAVTVEQTGEQSPAPPRLLGSWQDSLKL